MKEYERISLDRFDGKNLQSTVYFLSHLHEGESKRAIVNVLKFRTSKKESTP